MSDPAVCPQGHFRYAPGWCVKVAPLPACLMFVWCCEVRCELRVCALLFVFVYSRFIRGPLSWARMEFLQGTVCFLFWNVVLIGLRDESIRERHSDCDQPRRPLLFVVYYTRACFGPHLQGCRGSREVLLWGTLHAGQVQRQVDSAGC